MAAAPFEAPRRVIDVCGDGTNNNGPDVAGGARQGGGGGHHGQWPGDHQRQSGVWTFAHVQPPGGLANYYRENVTGGPGSFVLEVHDFRSFGTAMTRKLINEIALRGVPPARF